MMQPPGGGYGPAKSGGMLLSPQSLPRPGPYDPSVQVNEDGLPIRPGKEQCLVYLNTGQCNNGISCIFDHPRQRPGNANSSASVSVSGALPKGGSGMPPPTAGPCGPCGLIPPAAPGSARLVSPAEPSSPASAPMQAKAAPQGGSPISDLLTASRVSSGPSPAGPAGGSTVAPPGIAAGAGVPVVASMGSSASPSGIIPSAAPSSPPGLGGEGGHSDAEDERPKEPLDDGPQTEYNEDGLPLRPGAQKCGFYLRSGQCNYGPTCRFDHPAGLGGIMAGPTGFGNFPQLGERFCTSANEIPGLGRLGWSTTNEAGMARRPGKEQCPFLSRTGTCPFGPECRFDHASGEAAPAGSASSMSSRSGRKDRGLGGAKGRRPVASLAFRRP